MKTKKRFSLRCEARKKKEGALWEVVTIQEGKSQNNVYYPAEVLKRDYKRLHGAGSFIYQLGDGVFEHLPEEFVQKYNGPIGNLIGWFRNPHIETIKGKVAIVADLYIHKAAQQVRDFFKDCWEQGKQIGFSITALASSEKRAFENETVDWITEIWFISVDPVSFPAVEGAEALHLLESEREEFLMLEQLKERILELAKKIAPETVQEDNEEFGKTTAVALINQLVESLDSESFPEADVKVQLSRLRDAIEDEDDETAMNILENLLSLDDRGEQLEKLKKLEALLDEKKIDKALEFVTQLTESAPRTEKRPTSNEIEQKLVEKFGSEKATRLRELLGDAARLCLSEAEDVRDEKSLLWDKLEALQMLLNDNEIEAAQNLLKAILSGEYSEEPEGEEEEEDSEYPLPEQDEEVKEEDENMEGDVEIEDVEDLDDEELSRELDELEAEIANGDVENVDDEELSRELDELEAEIAKLDGDEGDETEEEIMENQEIRIAKIELEKLLGESQLPEPTKAKLRSEFEGRAVTTETLENAFAREEKYLKALNVKMENRQIQAFETQMATQKTQIQESFDNELKALRKEKEELKKEVDAIKDERAQTHTQAILEQKLKEAQLTKVSESRVRKSFEGKVATAEDIEKVIASEVQLTTQIISEMASTVTHFGQAEEAESEIFDEAAAEKIVFDFFGSRMNVTEETTD